MDSIQITILTSILGAATTIGGIIYGLHRLTKEEIGLLREDMKRIDAHHREDMKMLDAKFLAIDEKWERLFERLLIQDKEQRKNRG